MNKENEAIRHGRGRGRICRQRQVQSLETGVVRTPMKTCVSQRNYQLLERSLGVLLRLSLVSLRLNLGQPLLLQAQLLRLGLDLVGAANHIKGELGRVTH